MKEQEFQIKEKIENIRKWFLSNESFSEENSFLINEYYNELMELLKEGVELNLYYNPVSFVALEELFYQQQDRIKKISSKNRILLTGEPEKTKADVYQNIRYTIVNNLFE